MPVAAASLAEVLQTPPDFDELAAVMGVGDERARALATFDGWKEVEDEMAQADALSLGCLIWGDDDYVMGRSLDVFISRLRKYLKSDPAVNIENIHGIGFRMKIDTQ